MKELVSIVIIYFVEYMFARFIFGKTTFTNIYNRGGFVILGIFAFLFYSIIFSNVPVSL